MKDPESPQKKSGTRRPLEKRFAGAPKKLSPYGGFSASAKKGNASSALPVSVNESPKLANPVGQDDDGKNSGWTDVTAVVDITTPSTITAPNARTSARDMVLS